MSTEAKPLERGKKTKNYDFQGNSAQFHYCFRRSKYFNLVLAPKEGFNSNWIMR